jgi:hypothetical protein
MFLFHFKKKIMIIKKNDIVKQKGANNYLFCLEFIVLIDFWQANVTN